MSDREGVRRYEIARSAWAAHSGLTPEEMHGLIIPAEWLRVAALLARARRAIGR